MTGLRHCTPSSVAFSADSRLLAVGGIGTIGNIDHPGALARVEVFDWQKGERVHEFPGDTHKGLVERLIFHPRGEWLLAAGGDLRNVEVQLLVLELRDACAKYGLNACRYQ